MTKVYERPAMQKLGSFESLTKSTFTGTNTDAAYGAQAPSIIGALS